MARSDSKMASADQSQERKYLLGARLAGLLINVGTSCLCALFNEKVKYALAAPSYRCSVMPSEYHLKVFLDIKSVKKKLMDSYKKRLLRDEQWALLYPDASDGEVDSAKFDLTLLVFLLRNLELVDKPGNGWDKMPDPEDNSCTANIIRLRAMRNMQYGHLASTGFTNPEYKKCHIELKKILQELGADPTSIEAWKNRFSAKTEQDNAEMKATYEKLNDIIRSDFNDMQILANDLIRITESIENRTEERYQQFLTAMEAVRKDINGENSAPSRILAAFTSLQNICTKASLLFENMHQGSLSRDDLIKDIYSSILESNVAILKNQQGFQQTILDMQETQGEILDNILLVKQTQIETFHELKLEKTKITKSSHSGFLFDANDWKTMNDPFRIIVCTSVATGIADEALKKKLGNALGYCPWQVIIDIDYRSQSPDGLFDHVAETLRNKTAVEVLTYKNAHIMQEHDKEAIVKGEKALWMLANGSEAHECEPCLHRFGKAATKLEHLLVDIVGKFPNKKGLLCIVLSLSCTDQEVKALEDIGTTIKRLCENLDEKINLQESQFCVFAADYVGIRALSHDFPSDSDEITWKRYKLPIVQFIDFFEDKYGGKLEKKYKFPGAKGSLCHISSDDYAQLKSVMELYYEDIGKINTDAMSEEEITTTVNSAKYRFLKGNAITPEALYVHENQLETIYVVRKEMKEIKEIIREELRRRLHFSETNHSKKGIFLLEHSSSGGGTTCGRYLLFSLRMEYPCIEVKQFGPRLAEWLRTIHDKSDTPLLLVIDNLECQTSDIVTLQRSLENKWIKGLVVHIKRQTSTGVTARNKLPGEMTYRLSSEVTSAVDKLAFKKLYDTNENRAFGLKVFMFGLYKFLEEYKKIDQIVGNCVAEGTSIQLTLLRVLLYLWKYVHSGVRVEAVKMILNYTDDNLEEALGCTADFLVYESRNMRLRPANNCIIEPFLKKMEPSDPGKQMEVILDDIQQLSRKESDDKKESFELVTSLFIQSRKIDQARWTEFIEDLEKTHTKEYVLQKTEEFLSIFSRSDKCAHLRTFFARYLMYKMEDPEEAIKQIQVALGVEDTKQICETRETDMVLLSAYGNLHREMFRQKCVRVLKQYKKNPRRIPLEELYPYASEAIEAFSKAQKSTKTGLYDMREMYSANTFRDEALVQYQLLNFIFLYKCSKNHVDFNQYITASSTAQLVKDSLPRALKALQDLEHYMLIGRVVPDVDITESMTKIKFDLLRLSTDTYGDVRVALQRIPDNIPCDFGYCFHDGIRKAWRDWTLPDLELIVELIGRRVQKPELMLRSNYRDIVCAMIYIRQCRTKQDLGKYNLKLAGEYAAEWVKNKKADFEAHFMLGFLNFVQAINDDNVALFKSAQQSFEECKKLCMKHPSMPAYCQFRYWIGCGEGLEKALPYEKSIAKSLLQEFEGRQTGREVAVRYAGLESAFRAIIKNKTGRTAGRQEKLIKFNVALAYDRILALESGTDTTEDQIDELFEPEEDPNTALQLMRQLSHIDEHFPCVTKVGQDV